MKRLSLLLTIIMLTVTPSAFAEVFLEIEGIPGDSKLTGYENAIEIDSFQWAVADIPGSKASCTNLSDATVTKQTSGSSSSLIQAVGNAAIIPNAKVTFGKVSGAGVFVENMVIKLTNVRLTNFNMSSDGNDSFENISLSHATAYGYVVDGDEQTSFDVVKTCK